MGHREEETRGSTSAATDNTELNRIVTAFIIKVFIDFNSYSFRLLF